MVVMTTEVLRNMLYERSGTLDGLVTVIMDEVHYLQDPYRGAVWEEVLIHLALSVSVVCLSATISNAEEFGEWIQTLRGETTVVIEERRPVPLEHHYLVGRRLHPMHIEQEGILMPNPYVVSLDQQELRVKEYRRVGSNAIQTHRMNRPREGHRRVYVPRREEVVGRSWRRPRCCPRSTSSSAGRAAIGACSGCASPGIRLTTRAEADRIRERAESRAAWIDEEDLVTLGFYEFLDGLTAGVAAHHAGCSRSSRRPSRSCSRPGLVKVVFATETLSLGINMPARTVVIEDLWKFQGERHEILTPGEYTQLTGRAGTARYRRSWVTPSWSTSGRCRSNAWRASRRPGRTTSTRRSARRTTWRSTWCATTTASRRTSCSTRRSRSSWPTAASFSWSANASATWSRSPDTAPNLACDLGDFDEYWGLL